MIFSGLNALMGIGQEVSDALNRYSLDAETYHDWAVCCRIAVARIQEVVSSEAEVQVNSYLVATADCVRMKIRAGEIETTVTYSPSTLLRFAVKGPRGHVKNLTYADAWLAFRAVAPAGRG